MKPKKGNERKEFDNWDEEDKFSAWTAYFDLVEKLHNNMDLIPQKVQEDINDLVYMHYEP